MTNLQLYRTLPHPYQTTSIGGSSKQPNGHMRILSSMLPFCTYSRTSLGITNPHSHLKAGKATIKLCHSTSVAPRTQQATLHPPLMKATLPHSLTRATLPHTLTRATLHHSLKRATLLWTLESANLLPSTQRAIPRDNTSQTLSEPNLQCINPHVTTPHSNSPDQHHLIEKGNPTLQYSLQLPQLTLCPPIPHRCLLTSLSCTRN